MGDNNREELEDMNESIIQCPVCLFSVDINSASEFKEMDVVMISRGHCHEN